MNLERVMFLMKGVTKQIVLLPHKTLKTVRTVCHEFNEKLEVDPNCFSKVITGNKRWCYRI